MSGTYVRKQWHNINYFLDLYEVEEPKLILYIMKLWESILISYRADKADRKRKAEERKSAGGGKQYTHNVKG